MIKIESKFVAKIISKLIQHFIKKEFGYKVKVNLNKLNIGEEGDEVNLHLDVEAKMKSEDFEKLLNSKKDEDC